MREESGCCLYRILRRAVASGESGGTKMCHAFEAAFEASQKYLATPDTSVVAESGAVTDDADDIPLPFPALGKDGGQVRAMMLHGMSLLNRKRGGVAGRQVLRVPVVYQEEIVESGCHTSKSSL